MSDSINIKQISQLSEIEVSEEDAKILKEQIQSTLKNIESLFECELPENQKMWTQQTVSLENLRKDSPSDYVNPKIKPVEVSRMVIKNS